MRKHSIFIRHAMCCGVLLTTGCSLAPTYERPAAPIPAVWDQSAGTAQAFSSASLDVNAFVVDARLRSVIAAALANNRDLRQALLNVQAARALAGIQRADRLPTVQVEAGGMRQRLPGDVRAAGTPGVQSNYSAGVGLTSFELDLFGRVRSMSDAAVEAWFATGEASRSATISVVGEVIRIYLERNGAQERYLLATRTLEARTASLKLIEKRRTLGAAADLDVQDALGLVQQVTVERERIAREVRESGNALTLLTGAVDMRALLPEGADAVPMLVQDLSPGMPSDLLSYRPDIRAAEHQLLARNANIGAARAAFFPRISLTGMFGSASADLSDLFGSSQSAWSFAPQLTLPIFDGGRNRANLDLAQVRKDIAVAAYEQAIQSAFRDVSNALVATDTLKREEAAQAALSRSSTETLRLSELRYKAGTDDYLRYLDAQRSDLTNQMAMIQVRTQRQVALAGLFRALGGGWTASPGDNRAIGRPTR